jgi:D-cysteine desulfhydrase family pyridoxal phosphate-dependent enzyme
MRANSHRRVALSAAINALPRAQFLLGPTPIERQPRLSEKLGIDLLVKRDDLTGLAFGGNKVRQLEFYFGKILAAGADTVLITGAVQSNYVRVAAACAARLGLKCHIQLEERVPDVDAVYRTNGNVLINTLLGASLHSYPNGEDEAGADRRLHELAEDLKRQGHRPYVIPLGANNPPIGALGYVVCAEELLGQLEEFDHVVVASGSGHTQAGVLFGLRTLNWSGTVHGICVRRLTSLQRPRIAGHCDRLAELLGMSNPVTPSDIHVYDDVFLPGYGRLNDITSDTIRTCAQLDGLVLDPVYTGCAMGGLFRCIHDGRVPARSRVLFIHTGGLPALFGYATALQKNI